MIIKPTTFLFKPQFYTPLSGYLDSFGRSLIATAPLLAIQDFSLENIVFGATAVISSFALPYMSTPSNASWKSFLQSKDITPSKDSHHVSTKAAIMALGITGLAYGVKAPNAEALSDMFTLMNQDINYVKGFLEIDSYRKAIIQTPMHAINAINVSSIMYELLKFLPSYAKQLDEEKEMLKLATQMTYVGSAHLEKDLKTLVKHSYGHSTLSLASYYFERDQSTEALSLIMKKHLLSSFEVKPRREQELLGKRAIMYYDSQKNNAQSFVATYYSNVSLEERASLLEYYAATGAQKALAEDDLQSLALFGLYLFGEDKKVGREYLEIVAKDMRHNIDDYQIQLLAGGSSGGVSTLRLLDDVVDEQPVSLALVQKSGKDAKEEYETTIKAEKLLVDRNDLFVADMIYQDSDDGQDFLFELRYNEPTLREYAQNATYEDVLATYKRAYNQLPLIEEMLGDNQEAVDFHAKYPQQYHFAVEMFLRTNPEFVAVTDSIDRNFLVKGDGALRRIDLVRKGMGSRMSEISNLFDHSFDVLDSEALKRGRAYAVQDFQEDYNMDFTELWLHDLSASFLRNVSFELAWNIPGREEELKRLSPFKSYLAQMYSKYDNSVPKKVSKFAKRLTESL